MKKVSIIATLLLAIPFLCFTQKSDSQLQNPNTRVLKNFNSDWVKSLVKTQVLSPVFFEKIEGIYAELNKNNYANLNENLDGFELEQNHGFSGGAVYKKASLLIEKFDFENAQKLLGKQIIANPQDDLARYLLGITQLSRGYYAAAASNFSKVNLNIAHHKIAVLNEFRDDVRFYFAISITMVPGGKPIAKTLFKQLNYEGSSYKSICKEMSELL